MTYVSKAMRAKVSALLETIVPLYSVTPDGALSTSAMHVRLYEEALLQLLDVAPSGLTVSEFEACAWKALTATVKLGQTSADVFDGELDKEIAAFKTGEVRQFKVCSRCYFAVPMDYNLNIQLWGSKLSISQKAPAGLSADQPEVSGSQRAFDEPKGGAYLTLRIHERTKGGALDRAMDDIVFLLGILNFTLNLGSLTWTIFSNERTLGAKLFPGRDVYLLKADGTADRDLWRYFTVHPSAVKRLSDKELATLEQHTKVLDRLSNLRRADRAFYRSFFELYFEALSERDTDSVVMRLWKAAEHLTGSQTAQHIANRLALTWDDREPVSAVCYALGHRRNWAMHNPKATTQMDQLPVLFRHFLENSVWKSLSKDVKGVKHWKIIMQMSDLDLDLDLATDAIDILKALR